MVNEERDINEMYEKALTKIKFSSFGKVKVSKKKGDEKLENLMKQRQKDPNDDDIEAKIAKRIMEIKSEAMTKELKILKQNKSRTTNLFRILRSIKGNNKTGPEATAVKDPVTGEMVTDVKAIKETALEYCVKTLEKNEPCISCCGRHSALV